MKSPDESRTTDFEPPDFAPLGYPTNLLAPGQTYASVNETIADIPLKRAPATMVGGLRHRVSVADDVFGRRHVAVLERRRHLGNQHSGRLGICDREFRLVGGNCPRGNVHLRDFAFAFSARGAPRSIASRKR